MAQELAVRTDDMSLAAYLSVVGFEFELERDEDDPDRGFWCFLPDAKLEAAVACFRKKMARVEPRRYQRELTHVRREMIDFISHGC